MKMQRLSYAIGCCLLIPALALDGIAVAAPADAAAAVAPVDASGAASGGEAASARPDAANDVPAAASSAGQQSAHAQADGQTSAGSSGKATPPKKPIQTLEQVVVTGTPGAQAVTQLDASYSIDVLSEHDLHDLNPSNISNVLKTVPGVFPTDRGSQDGNNVYVRGLASSSDSPFVSAEIDGAPLYPLPNVGWTSTLDFFRLDDSIKRVEVLQGGPSVLFSTGQPGAVMNFITKNGMETPDGSGTIRTAIGPHGYDRVDMFWGGRIAPTWYATIGGFARRGDGVHSTQYSPDLGGQWEGSVTKALPMFGPRSRITFRVRHTRDKGMFLTSAPVLDVNGNIKPYPGFDLRHDTLEGNDVRFVNLPLGNGLYTPADLAKGRGINLTDYQLKAELHFDNGITFSNNMNFDSGAIPIYALFNGTALPEPVQDFIDGSIDSANSNAALVQAAGGQLATSGVATFAHGGAVVPPTAQLLEMNYEVNLETVRSFTDEARLSKSFDFGNTVTLGAYMANFGYTEDKNSGNNMLMTLQNNARLVSLTLDNGVVVASPDGFASVLAGSQTNATWTGNARAAYVYDEQVFGPWTIEGGLRWQEQKVTGYQLPTHSKTNLDGDLLTLWDNNATVTLFDGQPKRIHYNINKPQWTIGVNRTLGDNNSIFARASNGYLFPSYQSLVFTPDNTAILEHIQEYTVGFKRQADIASVLLSAYYNHVSGQSFETEIEHPDGSFETVNLSGTSHAYGLTASVAVNPFHNFSIVFNGAWTNAHYLNFGNQSGNRVKSQPKLLYSVMPSYTIPVPFGSVRLFATYQHVGGRWNDPTNTAWLPAYNALDAGAQALVGPRWSFRFDMRNVTNKLGLAGGNARNFGQANGSVFYGSSIYGRTWIVSARYKFD